MAKVQVLMNNGTIKVMESMYARALVHVGKAHIIGKSVKQGEYMTKEIKAPEIEKKSEVLVDDELSLARSEYKEKFGKKAFGGWNLEKIKAKISEA